MVTFRCKQSGNTVSFSAQEDIESMRKEEHYEEIKDGYEETRKEETVQDAVKDADAPRQDVLTPKKRGRPARK